MMIRRFGHAGLTVTDLAAAERYYSEVLGFAVRARYPEDREVLLTVGAGDHLLLQAVDGDCRARSPYHVAFEVSESHRGVAAAERRLAASGIAFERTDHDGDPALYWRDPDGHLLEVYAAPGTSPQFTTATERSQAARGFVYASARPIDRAIFAHRFEDGSAHAVLRALAAYGNPDGGFGHALEPDVRCPHSEPIHTLTALELLREAGIRVPSLADGCARFLAGAADAEGAVPAVRPQALDYPAAAHWQGPSAVEPSLAWTMGLAAELAWQGCTHPWLARAVDACRRQLEHLQPETHHLLYAVRFATTLLDGDARERALARLCAAARESQWFVAETPVLRYGLTPLHYAPTPDAASHRHFDGELIEAHVDDLVDAQQGDGGWPIRFEPPSEAARQEWRGRWTVEAVGVLRAYGRLS